MDINKYKVLMSFDSLFGTLDLSLQDVQTIHTNISKVHNFEKSKGTGSYYQYHYVYNHCIYISYAVSSRVPNVRIKYFSRHILHATPDGIFKETAKMLNVFGLEFGEDHLRESTSFSEGHISFDIGNENGASLTKKTEKIMKNLYNKTGVYAYDTSSRSVNFNYGMQNNDCYSNSSCSFVNPIIKGQLAINQYDKLQEIISNYEKNKYWFEIYKQKGLLPADFDHSILQGASQQKKGDIYSKLRKMGYGILRIEFQIKRKFIKNHSSLPRITTLSQFIQFGGEVVKYVLRKSFIIRHNKINVDSPVEPYHVLCKYLDNNLENQVFFDDSIANAHEEVQGVRDALNHGMASSIGSLKRVMRMVEQLNVLETGSGLDAKAKEEFLNSLTRLVL